MTPQSLTWKKYPILNDGFICLVDSMGTDASICQAARVSYGNDSREITCPNCKHNDKLNLTPNGTWLCHSCGNSFKNNNEIQKDTDLIRYLLRHGHTTPFEMCEVKFLVRVPMDCWRQWIRHRTANVNEYSTRYTEAIDSQQTTDPTEWRLQATNNKQGSSGYLTEWPEGYQPNTFFKPEALEHKTPGDYLSAMEETFHEQAKDLYKERLAICIAKEQARKDLPLSTYTEAYWKCDLHNIFNFLRLRMDSHAQLEIRSYANAMAEIVKQLYPIAWQAFEDYQLNSMRLTALDIEAFKDLTSHAIEESEEQTLQRIFTNKREREECIIKLTKLGIL